MSVCASANPFNSRKVSARSCQQPLSDNERWAALNKNIFQDILNAILFQTTFSSASGKRQVSSKPDRSFHSLSPPNIAAGDILSDCNLKESVALENASEERKLGNRGEFLDDSSTKEELLDENRKIAPASRNSELLRSGSLSLDGNIPLHDNYKEKERKKPTVSENPHRLEIDQDNPMRNEIVRSFRRTGSRDCMSFSAPDVVSVHGQSESPFSVYCETVLARVPMMIIGLRPFIHPDGTDGNGAIDPSNPMSLSSAKSLVLSKCPTEISASTSRSDSMKTIAAPSNHLPQEQEKKEKEEICLRNDDRGRRAMVTDGGGSNDFRSTTSQVLNDVVRGGGGGGEQERFCHSRQSSEINSKGSASTASENRPVSDEPRDTEEKTENNKPTAGTRSSRDHSILTILGLLSTDEGEKKTATSTGSSKALDNKRLVGIGVTVTRRNRWMAVDKGIVYDMIDQVLNGERDFFMDTLEVNNSTSAPSFSFPSPSSSSSSSYSSTKLTSTQFSAGKHQAVVSSGKGATNCGIFADPYPRKRSYNLPLAQRNMQKRSGPGGDKLTEMLARCAKSVLAHDAKNTCQRIEAPVTVLGKSLDLKAKHDNKISPWSGDLRVCPESSLVLPNTHSATMTKTTSVPRGLSGKEDTGKNFEASVPFSTTKDQDLDGMSVLRSLLSDDDATQTDCHAASHSLNKRDVRGPRQEDAWNNRSRNSGALRGDGKAADDFRRPKRSRQSTFDSKKRRTNSQSCPSSFDAQYSLAASPNQRLDSNSCRALSLKWKSSMLLRVRTEEGMEDVEKASPRSQETP